VEINSQQTGLLLQHFCLRDLPRQRRSSDSFYVGRTQHICILQQLSQEPFCATAHW
jgi:hypothetical protein